MGDCKPGNLTGTNYATECEYIQKFSPCAFGSGFINYYSWQYCAFSNRGVPTFLMILFLIALFLSIAITADSFFAPCLVVVARMLRMSQNLAGVTLLALANGSPDVFSSVSAIMSGNTPDVGLALGSIFGAGILVNTIAAGVIMIIRPFDVMRRPVMKDFTFYFISVLWSMMILIRRKVELWSSLVLLFIYVIYVFVTGISRFVFVKCIKPEVTLDENTEAELPQSEFPSVAIDKPVSMIELVETHVEPQSNQTLSPVTNNLHVPGCYDNPQTATNSRRSSHRSSFKSVGTSRKLRRVPSSSHRNAGFVAKLIIANESIRQSNISRKTDFPTDIRRTQSHAVEKPSNEKITRFGSAINKYEAQSKFKIDTAHKQDSYDSADDRPALQHKAPTFRLKDDSQAIIRHDDRTPTVGSIITDEEEGVYTEFPGMFKHFLITICPIDIENWHEQSIVEKIQSIIQSPIVLILTITIPVIDDDVFMHGWCRILNSLQCIISPLLWVLVFKVSSKPFGTSSFLVQYFILIIGFLLCCAVFITSKSDHAPAYHNVFAIAGFVTSVVWIYEVANEIVNILTVFGVVFVIDATILGLSVLAFANSIGDLVSDISLAKKNFPRIGYAACVGGPLFNLLIGIGLPFTLKSASVGSIPITLQPQTIVLIFTALLVTTMNIIAVPLMKFHLRAIYGIILISLYTLYLIFVLLFASKVIPVTI